jgi:hypothetical protein
LAPLRGGGGRGTTGEYVRETERQLSRRSWQGWDSARRGICQATLKPGHVVSVKINPLEDGRLGGNYAPLAAVDGGTYE